MIYIFKKTEKNSFQNYYIFCTGNLSTNITATEDEIEQYKDILPCKYVHDKPKLFSETISNDEFFQNVVNQMSVK